MSKKSVKYKRWQHYRNIECVNRKSSLACAESVGCIKGVCSIVTCNALSNFSYKRIIFLYLIKFIAFVLKIAKKLENSWEVSTIEFCLSISIPGITSNLNDWIDWNIFLCKKSLFEKLVSLLYTSIQRNLLFL